MAPKNTGEMPLRDEQPNAETHETKIPDAVNVEPKPAEPKPVETSAPENIMTTKIPEQTNSDKPAERTSRRRESSGNEGRPFNKNRQHQRPRGDDRRQKPDQPRRDNKRPQDNRQRKQPMHGFVKLSVVIPAYNEEGNVNELLNQFNQVFSNLPYRAELIFVDDGSTDKTLVRAKDSQANYNWLKVYSHRTNMGLTAALETGFSKAMGKIICFYPADLQYHASEIPRFVSKIDSGADVVTGWKQGKYGLKAFGSFIYNKLSQWLFKVKVHDMNSIKAFKREVVESFTYRRGWHRYMVVMAAQAGYVLDEVKVKLYPRKSGKSKFGLMRLPIGFLDLLSVKFELSFTRKPLLLFGSAGLISGFLGFVIGVIAIYLRFVEHEGFRPLLYAVILLMVMGLLLFAIGFLAELIVGIKEEISRKKTM